MAYMEGFYSTAEGQRWLAERMDGEVRSWNQYLVERGRCMPMINDEKNNEIYYVDEHGRLVDPAELESEREEIEVIFVPYAFCKQDDGYILLEDCEQCDYCEVAGEKRYCSWQK